MARKIELITVDIDAGDGTPAQKLDYAKMLRVIVKTPAEGKGGFDATEMDKALRVIDKLTENGAGPLTEVILEDADWEYLNTLVQAFKFGVPDHKIRDFQKAVENAPEHKI